MNISHHLSQSRFLFLSGSQTTEGVEMSGQESDQSKTDQKIQEKSLERMEALLKQSAMGIHILFDNNSIAKVMGQGKDDKDFFDFNKMKRVQDVMTELIAKKSYYEKMSFLKDLDDESYEMLVRTYFHIVENTVRAAQDQHHWARLSSDTILSSVSKKPKRQGWKSFRLF